jgi:hypothetical protein
MDTRLIWEENKWECLLLEETVKWKAWGLDKEIYNNNSMGAKNINVSCSFRLIIEI